MKLKKFLVILVIVLLAIPDIYFIPRYISYRILISRTINKTYSANNSQFIYYPSPNQQYMVLASKSANNITGGLFLVTPDKKVKSFTWTDSQLKSVGVLAIPLTYKLTLQNWVDNNVFTVLVTYQNGQKYVFDFDASQLKAVQGSFKPAS